MPEAQEARRSRAAGRTAVFGRALFGLGRSGAVLRRRSPPASTLSLLAMRVRRSRSLVIATSHGFEPRSRTASGFCAERSVRALSVRDSATSSRLGRRRRSSSSAEGQGSLRRRDLYRSRRRRAAPSWSAGSIAACPPHTFDSAVLRCSVLNCCLAFVIWPNANGAHRRHSPAAPVTDSVAAGVPRRAGPVAGTVETVRSSSLLSAARAAGRRAVVGLQLGLLLQWLWLLRSRRARRRRVPGNTQPQRSVRHGPASRNSALELT